MNQINEKLHSILTNEEVGKVGKLIENAIHNKLEPTQLVEELKKSQISLEKIIELQWFIYDLQHEDLKKNVSNGTLFGIYCIHDILAERYSPPFVGISHKVAIRSFEQSLKMPDIAKNDFTLVYLGDFDDKTGIIDLKEKSIVITGADINQETK